MPVALLTAALGCSRGGFQGTGEAVDPTGTPYYADADGDGLGDPTVAWPIPAAGLPTDQWSSTPDISSLIQRVVDRAGWSSGNHLSLAVWGETFASGCSENVFGSDSGHPEIPKLTVTFY